MAKVRPHLFEIMVLLEHFKGHAMAQVVGFEHRVADEPSVGPHEVVLVGAVPGSSELGEVMSPQMRAAADAVAEIARRYVEARGFVVRRRCADPVESDWWTRPQVKFQLTKES